MQYAFSDQQTGTDNDAQQCIATDTYRNEVAPQVCLLYMCMLLVPAIMLTPAVGVAAMYLGTEHWLKVARRSPCAMTCKNDTGITAATDVRL